MAYSSFFGTPFERHDQRTDDQVALYQRALTNGLMPRSRFAGDLR